MRTSLRFTVAAAVAASLLVANFATPAQAKKHSSQGSFSSQSFKRSMSSNKSSSNNSSQALIKSSSQFKQLSKARTHSPSNGMGVYSKNLNSAILSKSGGPKMLNNNGLKKLQGITAAKSTPNYNLVNKFKGALPDSNKPTLNYGSVDKLKGALLDSNKPTMNFPPGFDFPVYNPPGGDTPPANDPPANDPPANDPPANDPPGNDPPYNDPPCNDKPHCPKPPCYKPGWCGTVYPWPWPSTPCYGDYGYYYSQPSIITVPAAPVVVQEQAAPADLELVDVRFVDAGDAARRLGPLYRISVHSASTTDVTTAFEVALLAVGESSAADKPITSAARIDALGAGQTVMVDVRLPFEALGLDRDSAGRRLPFAVLYAVVDGQNNVAEVDDGQERNNNVRAWKRDDIRPVDLTFSTAMSTTAH